MFNQAHARAVVPVVQEHPLAVKEAAEAEMASMFNEVAADDAAMVRTAFHTIALHAITLVPIVELFRPALRELASVEVLAVGPVVCVHRRRAIVEIARRATIRSHQVAATRSARPT
jgi:hypothetical protein